MIGFYFDSGLTKPVSGTAPKRFLLELGGDAQYGSLYLGDPYTAAAGAIAAPGASTLSLDQTFEFPSSGSAIVTQNGVDTMVVNYTGKGNQSLTGVTGLTLALAVGNIIRPNITWKTRGNLVFFSGGTDLGKILVAFGQPVSTSNPSWQTSFGVAGGALITAVTQISIGKQFAVRLDVQAGSPVNVPCELTSWHIETSSFYPVQAGAGGTILASTPAYTSSAPGYASINHHALPQSTRLLPSNRQVTGTTPGFIIGQYAWRDENTVNAASIVPSRWDADVVSIGLEKFTSGIGSNDDLKPLDLVQPENSTSVFLNVQHGTYFDGPVRYFLAGSEKLEFKSGYSLTHNLAATPEWPAPVFVGTWKRGATGFYAAATSYRYQASAFNGTDPQFKLDRKNNTVTLNQPLTQILLFLGPLSGTGTDYFNLPVYPIWAIEQVYVDHGVQLGKSGCNFTFNTDDGTVIVNGASGLKGEPVYALCDPAVAILYETAVSDVRQIPVDLNPANSGLVGGFVYLRHRRPEPVSVTLSCDKPLIDVPATYSSVIDLVAYGPVYYGGDYALINATAFGPLGGETVAGVQMKVIVDPAQWSGYLNYQDPSQETITITTGADGIAGMVFVPSPDWGLYIPTTSLATTNVANDTIVLPTPLPISQVFDGTDWLATLYSVMNNDPTFGKVGANTANGEIAWATTGTPGTANYKTNGARLPWGSPYRPIQALDANGKNYTDGAFTGQVTSLVYAQAIPATSITGAFFITFLQRLTLQLQVVGSDIVSNQILLEMATPLPINENVWLRLNSTTNGQLNTFRLGYQPS